MFNRTVLSALTALAVLTAPLASLANSEPVIVPTSEDRWVPWPWSLAQPFPWRDIQGLWKVEDPDFVTYFAFKVVRERGTGVVQLRVRQYGESCKVIATGVGIERNQRVLAQMTGKNGVAYRVQLTAFSEKDSPMPPLPSKIPTQAVMVLSMGALEKFGMEDMVHSQIKKVSTYISQKVCTEAEKK